MMTGMFQTILILSSILLFYLQDTFYMSRFQRLRRASGKSRSYGYTFLVGIMTFILAVQPVLYPQLSLDITGVRGLAIQIAGITLIFLALVIHAWARLHLRQFYAERVEIQIFHLLVDTGPYALVRHPVIATFFLFATGLLLINPSFTTLFVLAFTIWDFSRAARQEEELLSGKLRGYRAYMERTPAFFPRLHRTGEQHLEH